MVQWAKSSGSMTGNRLVQCREITLVQWAKFCNRVIYEALESGEIVIISVLEVTKHEY